MMDGDKNTKSFHVMAKARKRRNSLSHIMINDDLVADACLIEDHIEFQGTQIHRAKLEGLPFKRVDAMTSLELVTWSEPLIMRKLGKLL